MKLYHGTTEEYAERILESGFMVKTGRSWGMGSGVYLTPDLECAKKYGETILEVDIKEDVLEEILDLDNSEYTLDGIRQEANHNEFSRQYKYEGDKIASYVLEELMYFGLKAQFYEGNHICFFSLDELIEKENIKIL